MGEKALVSIYSDKGPHRLGAAKWVAIQNWQGAGGFRQVQEWGSNDGHTRGRRMHRAGGGEQIREKKGRRRKGSFLLSCLRTPYLCYFRFHDNT